MYTWHCSTFLCQILISEGSLPSAFTTSAKEGMISPVYVCLLIGWFSLEDYIKTPEWISLKLGLRIENRPNCESG